MKHEIAILLSASLGTRLDYEVIIEQYEQIKKMLFSLNLFDDNVHEGVKQKRSKLL